MVAARTAGGLAYQEAMEEMDRELTSVVEDFDRAVNVEALLRTKETALALRPAPAPAPVALATTPAFGEHSFSQSLDGSFSTVPCRAALFA